MNTAEKVDLWQAINAYAEACNGDTSEATVSERRSIAVAAVDSVVWSNEERTEKALSALLGAAERLLEHYSDGLTEHMIEEFKDAVAASKE